MLGTLIVDGGLSGRTATGWTVIEHVGRHVITSALDLGNGSWELGIGTDAWRATDLTYERGVQGLKVDLDASDEVGTLYTIESNTVNTLTIATTDDLSGVVGQELVGVHEFKELIVRNGAKVDFVGNRLDVTDLFDSLITADSVIQNQDSLGNFPF